MLKVVDMVEEHMMCEDDRDHRLNVLHIMKMHDMGNIEYEPDYGPARHTEIIEIYD